MMRVFRKYQAGCVRTLLLSCCLLLVACQGEPDKPNVLLIVLDDFGYNDLAINNGSDSPTPTLDEIARQGIRFTRHYAESSCTASRVALLTGMYPVRVGAHPDLAGIDHELVTLADALRARDYTTYMIGKWHTGDSHRESRPEFQGFDHWFGFMSQLYLRGPHDQRGYKRGRPTYRNPWLETEQGELRQYQGHLTDIITDRALEVIREERDPWFIQLSYYAPHTPIEPAQQFAQQFSTDEAGKYQALKAQLDANIGRVIAALEASGELANTMIVVVSDNGGTAKSWPSNLPFYGAKATYTEGGVRTPLLMMWPEHWPAGQVNGQIAMIFDLYPTIMSALGYQVPEELDGVDLFAPAQDRELRWYSHHGWWGDTYGMLSANGQWRLSVWQGVGDTLNQERSFVSGKPANQMADYPEIGEPMRASMETWISPITQVELRPTSVDEKWTSYSRSAFMRTPLAGTHTMGLVFRRGEELQAPGSRQRLVVQDGYIEISEENGVLSIAVDGSENKVSLPAQEACFRLVIRSLLHKSNMVFFKMEGVSRISIHLNGEQVLNETYQNHVLNTASPRNPLRIAASPAGRWYMPEEIGPYLSTRVVSDKEIVEIIDPDMRQSCD
jgi:arylsulfatase A-like enzyme